MGKLWAPSKKKMKPVLDDSGAGFLLQGFGATARVQGANTPTIQLRAYKLSAHIRKAPQLATLAPSSELKACTLPCSIS